MIDLNLMPDDGITFDLRLVDNDLDTEDGLSTAVIISLFSNRRVSVEELPPGETDRMGWWADSLNEDNDLIGSKLWLLEREKITDEVLERAREYCEEALQWMIDDGLAESIVVIVERHELYQVSIEIQIQPPDDESVVFPFLLTGENSS